MPEVPHSVLSEHFQERMQGRRLRSAVFLTYQFDPGFFEQEVLPVFVDIPLSHAASIRLIQLEDALRELAGQVAVYYDANGLVTGDAGSAKLDIKRIPIQHHILRYWSLLSPEQRAAFLEARAPELAMSGQGADLVTRAKIALDHDTVFDRFAGFFHAFGCLERAVHAALEEGNEKEANYRLFGRKYDSLGSLLDRVAAEEDRLDAVDRYVISLCAQQLCQEIARSHPEYWKTHSVDVHSLKSRFAGLNELRTWMIEQHGDGFRDFLDWFDRWFVRRAEPVEVGS